MTKAATSKPIPDPLEVKRYWRKLRELHGMATVIVYCRELDDGSIEYRRHVKLPNGESWWEPWDEQPVLVRHQREEHSK